MSEPTPLYIVGPNGSSKGGVIVIQEAFGVNEHIKDVVGRFAAEGWLAVAPHLFHRSGGPVFCYEDDQGQIWSQLQLLTPAGVLADVDAAIEELNRRGVTSDRIAVVGFCAGGSIALATVTERDLGAGVTFYGPGISDGAFGFPPLSELVGRLRVPWLGLYGDLDETIPEADVVSLAKSVANSGTVAQVVRYTDAGHGFHCDRRATYHEASALDAWSRTMDWLEYHIGQA